MALTLAEELTLLAYDDESGKSTAGSYFDYGLGGALLAELALTGKVSLADKKVTVVDPTPTGDAMLDAALNTIASSSARKPQRWVEQLRKGTKDTVLRRLVDAGMLREESGKVLLVFSTTKYPARDTVPELEVRQRLTAAIVEGRIPEERTLTLAVLVNACGMGPKVFPTLDKKALRRKLNELTAGNWAAKATKEAIEAVQAAVMAASTAAVTTGAATGGGS